MTGNPSSPPSGNSQRSLRRPAPKVQIGLESMKQAVKVPPHAGSMGSETREISRSAKAYMAVAKRTDPLPPRGMRRGPLGLESIIGADDRKRILDTDLQPWRMICALEMTGADDSTMIGTGWLVGPRTIVTAGHCLYLNEFGPDKWARQVKVMPGRNGQERPFEKLECTAQSYSVDARWAKAVNDNVAGQDYDIGCIHLASPIGNDLGWFGIEVLSESELANYMVNVSGYPADRGQGTEQYHHANRIRNVTSRRIFYDVDTFGGQSGSPVWIQRDATSPPVAVAIHAYGVSGTQNLNSAPRIDAEVLELIRFWIAEDEKAAATS